MTPYSALAARVRSDAASPMLTYRDIETGERMELSAASLANAIAKTAGLLRDDLGASPGATVAVHLPLHWQRVVWLGACSATCTVFAPDAAAADADVCVVDRAHLPLASDAPESVVVSLAPFGLPEPGGLPPGITDAAVAMRSHPDTFTPYDVPDDAMPLLRHPDVTLTQGALMDRAVSALAERNITDGERFVVLESDPLADVIALAGPLVGAGAAVLVAGGDRVAIDAALHEEGVPARRVG